MGEITRGLGMLCRRNIGFASFLAWNYIALYGCGMAVGSFVPYNLEFIWCTAAAGTALVCVGLLARMRRGPMPIGRTQGHVAAGCAVAGNVALWLSYMFKPLFWVLFPIAGICYGVTIALFTVIWGVRLTACNEARIEFDVVACLVIAFALYTVTLPIKLWGLVDLAVACTLPCLSCWMAYRPYDDDPDEAWAHARHAHGTGSPFDQRTSLGQRTSAENPSLTKALVMMGALWFLVAFLRVVDAPIDAYDRYGRYLIAFATGFIVTLALFLVLIHAMRYVDMSMGYRWLMPFAAHNVLVLYVGSGGFEYRVVAYALVHAGMFGMQMSTWIALAKYLRRTACRPGRAFAGYALAEGTGIALGCGAGLWAVKLLGDDGLFCAVLVVMFIVVLVVMMTGFSADWYFARPKQAARHADAAAARTEGPGPAARAALGNACGAKPTQDCPMCDATPSMNAAHEEMMRARAEDLQRTFGLTERETEVAALLLGGRSRPFIRDELGISLNTVHAHARSILAKCGVHSQRELIDLEPDAAGAASAVGTMRSAAAQQGRRKVRRGARADGSGGGSVGGPAPNPARHDFL